MLSSGHGKSLGMAACTAIVVGNMVGSGFYLSPAAVAPYGNLAILIWLIMGAGAICLGLTFAKLARLVPATGGPYAYTRLAYGDFPGFLIAWGYWISIWASLPVIAVAFAGVVVDLFPAIRSRGVVVFITLAAIWAVVLINLRGVSTAGVFAQITTYAKLVPFGAIALLGIFFIDPSHFSEFNPSGVPLLQASAALAPLTMFAYLGLESATVPAGDVRDPERTIPRSTVLGIAIAAALYILGTVVVMGLVPRQQLVNSVAPFSDAAGSCGAARERSRSRSLWFCHQLGHLMVGRCSWAKCQWPPRRINSFLRFSARSPSGACQRPGSLFRRCLRQRSFSFRRSGLEDFQPFTASSWD